MFLVTKPNTMLRMYHMFLVTNQIHYVKLYKEKLPAFLYVAKRLVRSYHFNKFYSAVCFWIGDNVKNLPYVFGDQSKTHLVKL